MEKGAASPCTISPGVSMGGVGQGSEQEEQPRRPVVCWSVGGGRWKEQEAWLSPKACEELERPEREGQELGRPVC